MLHFSNLLFVALLTLGLCFPALAAKPVETKAQPTKKVENQTGDYQRMRMVREMDREGWGEPVEAFRLLIPSDWKADGGVRWVSDLGCPNNIIQVQFRATAPDGTTGVEFLPSYTWASSDDPMMQNIIQQQAQSQAGCAFGPVAGAVEYLARNWSPNCDRMRACREVWNWPLSRCRQVRSSACSYSGSVLVQRGILHGDLLPRPASYPFRLPMRNPEAP